MFDRIVIVGVDHSISPVQIVRSGSYPNFQKSCHHAGMPHDCQVARASSVSCSWYCSQARAFCSSFNTRSASLIVSLSFFSASSAICFLRSGESGSFSMGFISSIQPPSGEHTLHHQFHDGYSRSVWITKRSVPPQNGQGPCHSELPNGLNLWVSKPMRSNSDGGIFAMLEPC